MTEIDGERAFQEAVEHARQSGVDVEGFIPGDPADIIALEIRLGVQLPSSYKAMVALFGTVCFGSLEIYGLTKTTGLDAKGIPNVVFATEDARRQGLIGSTMVLFMASGYGPAFLFDCDEADEFGEAPVYEIPVGGVSYGRNNLSSSFGHFILDEVKRLTGN